eukprot:756104-Hanusia_phi.AAC.1
MGKDDAELNERHDSAKNHSDGKGKRQKALLTPDTALEIYSLKGFQSNSKAAESVAIAARFGVSAKAVRDIWDKKSWVHATMPRWTEAERQEYGQVERRGPGRPIGSKDKVRRKRKEEMDRTVHEVEARGAHKLALVLICLSPSPDADPVDEEGAPISPTPSCKSDPAHRSQEAGGGSAFMRAEEAELSGSSSSTRVSSRSDQMNGREGSPGWMACPTMEGIREFLFEDLDLLS